MPFSESERHRHRTQARVALAKLGMHERLAERYEAADCSRLRTHYAALYRRLIGVHPSQRLRLRESLQHIRADGQRPVPDLIVDVGRQSGNSDVADG